MPPTTTTPTQPATTAADGSLTKGDRGPAVAELQSRLLELGYWLPRVDGVFGVETYHAVVALQKVAGLRRDGIVGAGTSAALSGGVAPTPQSSVGRVAEIDLHRQVLIVADAGDLVAVFDVSTGSAPGTTPRGKWRIEREIDGLHRAPLGLLYRPKYFHEGVAIHGFTSVPSTPASHGCVRVTYRAMDHIWAASLLPVGTPVWVY